jgi:serine/threonine-protein kinase
VYEVVRLIGAGGMGTVYDVEDTTIGKRYVVKTLHPQLGSREDLAQRMQREARTLARLSHPNIVEVITAGVTGDDLRLPYYVMERLNGQSLRVVLEKKGQLELPHAYHIGIDLLDALDHAHDRGVIHRDVKPDNIFLHRTSAGVTVTKLLDFGILSLLDGTLSETAGRFLGTLRYAAPEQLRGEKPSPKMDIYAAGLVLYEMIAGRGPFDDEVDTQAIGAAHIENLPPRLSSFVAVPPELEALVMTALAKDPDARQRDAFVFAASLRQLKRAYPGLQPRESTQHGTEAMPRRDVPEPPRPAATLASQAPTRDAPLRWPKEGPPATSEAPHVQTLSVFAPRSRPVARMVIPLAAFAGVLLAGLFILVRHTSSSRTEIAAGTTRTAALVAPAVAPPVAPTPSATASPSSSSPASPPPTASMQTPTPTSNLKPVTSSVSPPRSKPRTPASASAKPAIGPLRLDRPGPGF